MRRGFGVGLSALLGLAILFSIPSVGDGADWGIPQIHLDATTPIRNGDYVTLSGSGFEPGEILSGFGAVVQIYNEGTLFYRGFNLSEMEVRADASGEFRLDVPLDVLAGVRGFVELTLYHQGVVIGSDFLPVSDSGIYNPSGLDATAGTLYFLDGSFSHGGPGEDPVVNDDDVPLTSNSAGDWSGSLFQVNLERYTTNDGTGTSTPYNNITNDVSFSGGDLVTGSSAIVAGLSATYKSIRMTVLVWDPGDYGSIVGTTTTGTTQGTGWLATADVTPPSVSSAQATSLTTIEVTFSEAVTTPSSNGDAIDNWTVTFNGTKAVSALSPLGSSGTTTVTLTVADLGDRGATPTVQFTTGSDEFEDESGNDCQSTSSPHITATDGIVPATPTLTAPTANTFMTGASVTWSAEAGPGTDTSLERIRFQGSNDLDTWFTLGANTGPYTGTYTFGTKYAYYRAQAKDTENNLANSDPTGNCQDAHHLDITTIPSSTPINVESGQWEVTVKDNYGNAESVTQTIGLSTSSSGGSFRATSGGPTVGSIDLISSSTGNFYYIDSQVGTPEIKVTNATLFNDSTNYTITAGGATNLLIKLPGQTFTSGTGVTGTPDFSSYGGSSRWAHAGTGFPVTLIIVDASNNLVSESGTRDIDFTTTAGSAPDGTNPTVNGSSFPVNNLSVSFTDGQSTTSITVVMYDFTQDYSDVTITASDNSGSPTLSGTASSGFLVEFDNANHIDWTNSSGVVTATPVNGTQTAGINLPTFYISALDAYDNRDTTYTGSTITTTGGSVNPPTYSPSGTGQGGGNAPSGNNAPDYGTSSTWSDGTVTLDSSVDAEWTRVYAATTTGFRIRALATGGSLDGIYTPDSDLFLVDPKTDNYLRIEDTSGGGGTEYVDGETFTTADSIRFWAISYDIYGNVIGNFVATWSSTQLSPAAGGNSTNWIFEPDATASNGTISITNGSVTDRTISNITVTADETIASIKIRTASGGGGDEVGAVEIAGAANGANYNRTDWLYAAGYNSDGLYITDVSANWGVTGTLTETGGSGFENADPSSSNRYTAVSASNQSGTITAEYNSLTDATGTVTVDATEPATVQGFDVTEDQDQNYINASWDNTSSYDDGSSAASGNVEDFDIRFSSSQIDGEAAWDAATSVGTSGKPASFNGSSSWRIYMAGFPAGYYYYAIKTMDPQGYWSDIGSGCYTTSPDYSLPVKLTTFQAKGSYGRIVVSWSTESEVDALGFRLLRDVSPDYSDPILVASYDTDPELICQGSSATGFDYSFVDQGDVEPETCYYYRLEAVDINGRIEASGLEASAEALPLPTDYELGQNFPNPFNPVTCLELKLPESGPVTVAIFNARGREVARILDHEKMEAGVYQLTWNGSNSNGQPMPSGIYFCRLQANGNQHIVKMLLLK